MRNAALLALVFALAAVPTTARQDLIVDVNLRVLDVFVEDEHGSAALDLSPEDFVVVENGQVRPVKHLSLEKHPAAIGLLVDRSSSIAPVKNMLDQAVIHVLKAIEPADPVFLMTFASSGKLNVAWTTSYLPIVEAIKKAKLGIGSRVYDAISNSLEYLSANPLERRSLILFSDGADHYSNQTIEQVIAAAKSNRISVSVLGYVGNDSRSWSDSSRREIRTQLEHLARMTGGNAFFPDNQTDCSRAARQILDRAHFEYRIGFYSSEPFAEVSDLQVKLRDKSARVSIRKSRRIS